MSHPIRNLCTLLGLLVFLVLLGKATSQPIPSQGIRLIGQASIPGDAVDASGLTDILENGMPHNRLGSHGSGIAYSGQGNRYLMTTDRGPHDGSVAFRSRVHEIEIVTRDLCPGSNHRSSPKI